MACCCSCKNLDTKKKAKGAVSGCRYYCKKMKTYVSGDTDQCPKYEKSFRKNSEVVNIYNEGRAWDNDTISTGTYLIILIALIILLIFLKIFSPNM